MNDQEIIDVVKKIFYSPATNGQAEKSIADGVEAVKELIRTRSWDADEFYTKDNECPTCGGSGVYEPSLCDVEGCKDVVSTQGGAWRETGYWCLCSKHYRLAKTEKQPGMKRSAMDREALRG